MKSIKLMKITAAFCVVLATAGFVFLLGSIGAMDCDNISTAQGFVQCLIGLGFTVGGSLVARLLFNEIEYRERKEILEEAKKIGLWYLAKDLEDDYKTRKERQR